MKRFLLLCSFFAVPYYLIAAYYFIFVSGARTGDLGILGEIPFGQEYGMYILPPVEPDLKVVEFYDGTVLDKKYSIVSIGDSFSRQGKYGYQNYLANLTGEDILNLNTNGAPTQTALYLLKNGFLKDTGTEYVIIEIVLRNVFYELAGLDFNQVKPSESLFITPSTGNSSAHLLDNLFRYINNRLMIRNPVRKERLKEVLFSHPKYGNYLYYYKDDMSFLKIRPNAVKKAYENLLELKNKFHESGLGLIYIVAADKYSVYQDYLSATDAPRNTLLDQFGEVNYKDWFVNTQSILSGMVSGGEHDVYLINDTHWSYKGSMEVSRILYHRIYNGDLFQ